MPWCASCDAYRAPSAVRRDGTCSKCGQGVEPGSVQTKTADDGSTEKLPPVPWHLKILGVATAAYLGLRAWQGVELLLDKL